MDIKFDEEAIRLITLFEAMTGASVRDCLIDKDSNVVYMIIESKLGAVIGKGGKNIKAIEKIIRKRIKLFEFSPEVDKFARKVIPQANKIAFVDGRLEIQVDKDHRAIVIGREGKNLSLLKEIFRRNFGVKDIILR